MLWHRPSDRRVVEPAPGPQEPPDALLRRLSWTVLRPLAVSLGGDERSVVRGPGMEISEVREYQPGDDVRHIDWNLTARSDRPYVRESDTERALDVWLLLDLSGSIDWGTAECTKRTRALEFAAVAGRLLGGHGNRLGMLPFAERPLGIVPPGAGHNHLLRALGSLGDVPRQEARGATDLAGALKHASDVIRRRSLVLVVSDFLAPDGWQAQLSKLAARHEVVAVRLRDPREESLPDVGILTFEDPETGRQLTVDTGDKRLRERFAEAAREQASRVSADLAACKVDGLVLGTDAPLLPELARFLHLRRARKQRRGAALAG
jgi:uncharacterized protein (DUF58 family)